MKKCKYCQIEFICYDKDNNNLGTAIDNTNNLLENQTWNFKAMGLFTDSKMTFFPIFNFFSII